MQKFNIVWSILLICLLEATMWTIGSCEAPVNDGALEYLEENTRILSRYNTQEHSYSERESKLQDMDEELESNSGSHNKVPSFLTLGATLSLAAVGAFGLLGSAGHGAAQTFAMESGSSESAGEGTSDDDEAAAGRFARKQSVQTHPVLSQQTPSENNYVPSPFATATMSNVATLAMGAAVVVGSLATRGRTAHAVRSFAGKQQSSQAAASMPLYAARPTSSVLGQRAFSSSAAVDAAVPPPPPATPFPSLRAAAAGGLSGAQKTSGAPHLEVTLSAENQQLLRDALKSADRDLSSSMQRQPLEVEALQQTVADILAEAVRQPRVSEEAERSEDEGAENLLYKLSDKAILEMMDRGELQAHQLEKALGDLERAVFLRRKFMVRKGDFSQSAISQLPFENYDYNKVVGACCENVVGYVPLPIGIAGPVTMDGEEIPIPMATTEGCLVASTHRGAKAVSMCGGAKTAVLADGMTRAPVVRLKSAVEAARLRAWLETPDNYETVCNAFNSTSRFARVQKIDATIAGRAVFLRFRARTGDAMGMNMISKGVEQALAVIQEQFPDMQILALSGNMCTDKKPSAMNWIEGRGKSVVAEATISGDVVRKVLKTTVKDIVDLNTNKNLIGSAMAGSIGGFNAHSANIVTAMYLALGQDPAQNVESSNCMTLMEAANDGEDLWISVTMPSIEVGTVGGGTHLPAQSAALEMMNIRGANVSKPGDNAKKLARSIATGVLCGELSLMSALAAGHLVKSHMQLNRKVTPPAPGSCIKS